MQKVVMLFVSNVAAVITLFLMPEFTRIQHTGYAYHTPGTGDRAAWKSEDIDKWDWKILSQCNGGKHSETNAIH